MMHQRLGLLYPSPEIVEEFVGLVARRHGGWRDEGAFHLALWGKTSNENPQRGRLYMNKDTGVVSFLKSAMQLEEQQSSGWQALIDCDEQIARQLIDKNRRPVDIAA